MLIQSTTRMSNAKEQNCFLSVLLGRKGEEACLFTKTLDKTPLKAVPFYLFYFFQDCSVELALYGYTSEGIL